MLSHRMSKSPEYRVWCNMRGRCNNEDHFAYKNYGARGIRVCPEWDFAGGGFEAFIAHVGNRPSPKHELDRINNDGNYEPGNVRWVTCRENNRNRRSNRYVTINGETKTRTEWAEIAGISPALFSYRLKSGWDLQEAIAKRPHEQRNRPDDYVHPNTRFLRADHEQWASEYMSGASARSIAEKHGTTCTVVTDALKELGAMKSLPRGAHQDARRMDAGENR